MKRSARFAGTWYPADVNRLDALVSGGRASSPDVRLAVLPHAGLYYSAGLIANAFASLSSDVRRVLIISPSHYYGLDADLLAGCSFTSAETPYGQIPVFDSGLADYDFNPAIQAEHGLEMFLPFIAKRTGLSVSFLLISQVSSESALTSIADRIESALDDSMLLIASSDFTHYGPRFGYMPYGRGAEETVMKEDRAVATALAEGRLQDVFPLRGEKTICGIVPAMLASILASRRGLAGRIDQTSNSNIIAGKRDDDFVSYASVFWG